MSQLLQPETRFVATPAVGLNTVPATTTPRTASVPAAEDDSLFERFAWLYVFFRERIFRDDTDRIIRALWSNEEPAPTTRLLELGCGPGFYSCRMAERFPMLDVVGVDRSIRQLKRAQTKAEALGLRNCRFETDNVLALSHPDESFEALITSRLFTVLPDEERAVSEIYRVLSPGGHWFIAEPRYAFWASLPLFAMWLLAGLTGMNSGCREPGKATVLTEVDFEKLFASQPWRKIKIWQDGRYQYALCEKG